MINPETLLPWSAPESVATGRGPKKVRKADPTPEFWELWRTRKDELKALGIQPSRYSGCKGNETGNGWTVYWWTEPTGAPSPATPKPSAPIGPVTLAPDIAEKLRDYQRAPAATLVAGAKVFPFLFDGSDMGAGKSYTAMAVCRSLGLNPVIICRKAAFSAWKKVAAYFGFLDPVLSNYEYVRTGNSKLGTWKVIELRKPNGKTRKAEVFQWTLPPNSFLVLDEVHWCTGTRTQNSDLLMGAAYQKIPCLGLSATAGDSPLKFRALGYALGLHHGRDFDEWAAKHGCEKGKWGLEFNCGISRGRLFEYSGKDPDSKKPIFKVRPEVQEELDRKRRDVMLKIHHDIYDSGRGVRIRINDVPGFPEIEVAPYIVNFDTSDEIERAYAELNYELEGLKKSSDRLAAMRKAHKKIELLKVDVIADEVNEVAEQGYSVLVFTNFNDSLDKMADLCKTKLVIRGGQRDDERVWVLDEFQSNRQHKMILNNQAGGESIGAHDLHGERQRISYLFPTFWANAFRQCTGRTRRDGAKSKSIIKIPYAAGTVEEDAYESVQKKCDRIDMLNDGDFQAGLRIPEPIEA